MKFEEFEVIELEEFRDEYVYDIEMLDQTQPWFFANEILIHNSQYLSLFWLDRIGITLQKDGKISDEFYSLCDDIEDHINQGMDVWARKSLRSTDPRFVFKRESICDSGIFIGKKYYALHILDDEGVETDKFKYKGVDVVKTTMPKVIKPYVKNIIEKMILTRDLGTTNKLFNEAYEIFKGLPIESVAKISGMNNYEQYSSKCSGPQMVKGMPYALKAAYMHDHINKQLGIDGVYDKFKSGDKVRIVYVKKPNKYNIDSIGFRESFPEEYSKIFTVDYEKMFDKIIYKAIERFYDSVNWKLRKPNENLRIELEDFLSEDDEL